MDFGTAIIAGLVATAVMTALMYLGRTMTMEMDMPRMLGLMVRPPDTTGMVYLAGFLMHFMMGAIFGLVYASLFEALNVNAGLLWGGVFGAVHGIAAGLAMGMMPVMHPRMGEGQVLSTPGPFAVNWGGKLPVGIIMLHIIFGAVIGLVY